MNVELGLASSVVIAATVVLAACAPAEAPPRPPGPMLEHIHELVADEGDDALLVATHEGLYRLTVGTNGSATAVGPIGGLDFDPMGFTIVDGTAYASGHPGPTTPQAFGSPNLGLITSSDLGETWANVSLTGVTDFHGLTVMTAGDDLPRVFGIDPSKPRVQRSLDAGATWSDGAELVARDILAVGDQLYATTPDGLAISADDGITFTVDATAPALYILSTDQDGTIAGVDTTGTLWVRVAGQEWVRGDTVTGTPQALAVEGTRVYVADDRGIAVTDDAGATWTVLRLSQ